MTAPLTSLSFLADFCHRSDRSRSTIVRRQRELYESPEGKRFGPQYYSKVVTAAVEFINSGLTGGQLRDVVESAAESRTKSFASASAGLLQLFAVMQPVSARRAPRGVYLGTGGEPLLNVAPHLVLETSDDEAFVAFLHFKDLALEDDVIDMLLLAMARSLDGGFVPAIVLVRSGELIDGRQRSFDRPELHARIEREVTAIRSIWDAA
jgi:hypothetical protein